jgi:hypothetical protein
MAVALLAKDSALIAQPKFHLVGSVSVHVRAMVCIPVDTYVHDALVWFRRPVRFIDHL